MLRVRMELTVKGHGDEVGALNATIHKQNGEKTAGNCGVE